MQVTPGSPETVLPHVVRRKVAWHILPLIFFLYLIAYLDRANVSFAKVRMQSVLNWSDDVFGFGFGIFFFGYILLEIPGALLVEHWSARKWFTRILLTWGLCSMAMALVRTPWQFYLARFLLGLAEAGFFPGVIVYFTHWFPRAQRGRAFAGLVLGVPFSLALGARVSGYLLEQNWFGIPGWQWVFLVEGAPAVLMGLVLPWLMSDRPSQARWLTAAESAWLENTLAGERQQAAPAGALTMWQEIRQRYPSVWLLPLSILLTMWQEIRQAMRYPSVWLLALGILATNTGGYGIGMWLPTFVNNMLHVPVPEVSALALVGSPLGAGPLLGASALVSGSIQGTSPAAVWNFLGLFYLCGLAGVWFSGKSSDWTGDRKWHCITGQVLTGVFLAISVIPGQAPGMVFLWFCLVGFFAYFWPTPFWVLPTLTLSSSAAAVSIGFINICANVAGMLGPPLVGRLKTMKFGDETCLVVLACFYIAGGVIIALLQVKPKTSPKGETKA